MINFDELNDDYINMCNEKEHCSECKYNGNFPCQLAFGYDKGRADQKERDNAFFNFEGARELEKIHNVDCEIILDIIRDALLEYNFGSDSPRLAYKDGYLIYCSTNYDWFRIKCDYEPKSILFSAMCLILEDMFNLDWNKF